MYLHRNNLPGKSRTGLSGVNNVPLENRGVYVEEEQFAYAKKLKE